MKLFTKPQLKKLIKNAEESQLGLTDSGSHTPVVKLFTPDAQITWLVSEYHQEDGTVFGLCDDGGGFPELGYTSLYEIANLRGNMGLKVERDKFFKADKPIEDCAQEARLTGRIEY